MTLMWNCLILLLCATGISAGILVEAHTNNVNLPLDNQTGREIDRVRRYACPVGFFRLKRNCYYLSAGVAQWRDAHFRCKERNSTLAVLDKNGKDRILRKYLMGEQFNKLERWIGGIYNWQTMTWQWSKGENIKFKNFAGPLSSDPLQYAWHCIVLDPKMKYKWSPRSCLAEKHYVCQVPAGRRERRRKKTIDPALVPQNQRLKLRKHPKRRRKGGKGKGLKEHRRGRIQTVWNDNWMPSNDEWAHGVKLGSRPLSEVPPPIEIRHANRTRHQLNRHRMHNRPTISTTTTTHSYEDTAFLGDSPNEYPKALADEKIQSQYHAKINELSLGEVLLKT